MTIVKSPSWKKVLEFSLPAVIAGAIFVLSMIIKQVQPFGLNQFGYIDYNSGLVPAYTGLWDFLHGDANFFVNWNLGAGGNVYASWILNSFLCPINFLVAIFPRESIIYSISLLMVIKLALMATTAYVCFKNFFKNCNSVILLLFSILWTYSGWTLVHYTNIGWLDLMILLPLLVLALKNLVKNGKSVWFVVILSYMLMLSYYISYMVLVGILLVGLTYFCIFRKDVKKVASKLFFSIIISILISAVAFIPSCITSLGAHRFGSANTDATEFAGLFTPFFSKFVTITMFALPVVFFVRLMFKIKQDKKTILFFLISFIILACGLIIEPINKMWHTGSYYCFPYRYSFLIILLMTFASLYYIDHFVEQKEFIQKEKSNTIEMISFIIIGAISLLLLVLFFLFGTSYIVSHPYRDLDFGSSIVYLTVFGITYVVIELCLRLKTKKLRLGNLAGGILIFVLCLAQILSFNTGFISYSYPNSTGDVDNALRINTSELSNQYKLKDADNIYMANFAYFTNFPSLSTWIHISSEEQWVGHSKLGYQSASTSLYSAGGTVLTDILLGNKYVLTKRDLPSQYYTKLDSFEFTDTEEVDDEIKVIKYDVNLYELNFNINPVFTTDVDLSTLLKDYDYKDSVEVQNVLYKTLFNQEENIMSNVAYTITEEDDKFVIEATVPSDQIIYLQNVYGDMIFSFDEYKYRSSLGLFDFGINSSGTLKFEILDEDKYLDLTTLQEKLKMYSFDVEKFKTVYDASYVNNNSTIEFAGATLKISLDNTQHDKYAFVPFINLKDTSLVLNNRTAQLTNAVDTYMFVEIANDENVMQLTNTPTMLKVSLIITISAIVVFVVFEILNKTLKLDHTRPVVWIGFVGAVILTSVVAFLIYLKPLFEFFKIIVLAIF